MVRVLRKASANRNAAFYLTLAASGTPGGTRTPDLLLRRQLLYPAELKAHICFRTAFRLRPPKRAGAAQIKSEANADQSHITHTARRTPQYAAAGIRPRRLFRPDAPAAAGGGFYALDTSPAQGGDSAAARKYCRQSQHRTPHGAKDAAGRPNGRLREARHKPNPAARWSG